MKTIFENIKNKPVTSLFYGLLIFIGLSILCIGLYKKAAKEQGTYPFTLPPLPYKYDALEPHIDTLTMELHHNKHHQKYVDELNAALEKHPELRGLTIEHLLTHLDTIPEAIRTAVRNNGGGHYNHSFFWKIMAPGAGGEPTGKVAELIVKHFKDFAGFKEQFGAAAKKVFGSGWAWLTIGKDGAVAITTTANQDSPISQGLTPLLGLDVWEHAYYLKYHNKRPEYIDAWWNVVNWKAVEEHLAKAQASHLPPK